MIWFLVLALAAGIIFGWRSIAILALIGFGLYILFILYAALNPMFLTSL